VDEEDGSEFEDDEEDGSDGSESIAEEEGDSNDNEEDGSHDAEEGDDSDESRAEEREEEGGEPRDVMELRVFVDRATRGGEEGEEWEELSAGDESIVEISAMEGETECECVAPAEVLLCISVE